MVPFLTAGSVFASRFEIERLAGTGGMGSVYRAVDQLTLRWVALKIIHAHSSNPGDATRFIREAELLSELRHPGIVSYVAHGVTPQGQRFLAMEWLEGEDLAQRLLRGPLGLTDTRTLLYRVAESLAFAHQRGILHRDDYEKNTFCFLVGH
jgi:serine/threonine protein kinase